MFGDSGMVSSSSPKRVNSVSVRVRSSRIKVRIFGMARFSFDSVYLWLGSRLSNSTRSDSIQLGPTRLDSVHLASTQSTRADSVNLVDPFNSVRLSDNSTRKTR
ncbi:hypothetical protein Hanom_Chr02g00122981 [Helianthus anomalus]